MKNTSPKKFFAISLLELLLVLVVIIVLLTTSLRYYKRTHENTRTQKAIEMVVAIEKASYKWLGGANSPDFNNPGFSLQSLVDAQLLSSSYKTDSSGITTANAVTPWNGKIQVTYAGACGSSSIPAGYFCINFLNVSPNICNSISRKAPNDVYYIDPCGNSTQNVRIFFAPPT